MRNFRPSSTTALTRIAILFMLAASAYSQSGQVFFQTTTFGMVGLARSDVARVNVLNPGNSYGNTTPVCSAEMQFLDDQGTPTQVEFGRGGLE